ncbi:phosphoserine phosphatase [archaeon]|nr:phosphoserine phosphatase [archaeon]
MEEGENVEQKRDEILIKIEEHRRKRDELNRKASGWADKRDELNSKSRKATEDASECRIKRDGFNEKVRNTKDIKDKLRADEENLSKKLHVLMKKHLPNDGVYLSKLKSDLRKLEFKQQTTVLTPKKEKEIIDALTRIQNQVREREKILEENKEIKKVLTSLKDIRKKIRAEKKDVTLLANAAQNEHDKMNRLYAEADKIRALADDAQKKFVENKKMADKEHKEYVAFLEKIHGFDKQLSGLKQKDRTEKKVRIDYGLRKQAEEIYDRFKTGEKLSTEDLMILQKAGLL